jgi:hypothetical protein
VAWIGVDLDGTLAEYHGWANGAIGAPVPAMVARVKALLAAGYDLRIFTARVAGSDRALEDARIRAWCTEHLGCVLPTTAVKDYGCIGYFDDRALQVEPNTGRLVGDPSLIEGLT